MLGNLFQTTPHSMAPNELLQLRARLGGKVGVLSAGSEKADVVQVRENVYVTNLKSPIPRALEAMVNMLGADVHLIKNPADLELMKRRLEDYDG
jgi:hypothetical protein